MNRTTVFAAIIPFLAGVAPAFADVVVSNDPTSNMSCSGGVCAPTATDAVLNVTDLETLLASGSVSIVTTNGSVQANNIDVIAPFSWSAASGLTLDAYQSIMFSAVVQNLSTGNASLITNDGGSGGALTFTIGAGRLDTNAVSINAKAYKMASSVKQLAVEVVAKPSGHFALSKNTDAGKDGLYYNSPIPIDFEGSFIGLGHTISNLEIVDTTGTPCMGLFADVGKHGRVASVGLTSAVVRGSGTLAGCNEGTISNSSANGSLTSDTAGGLVGYNSGALTTSQSGVSVAGRSNAGGLVGENDGGIISLSFASGAVRGRQLVGGLVGDSAGANSVVENSYALGDVTKGRIFVGGFMGINYEGSVIACYAIGAVVPSQGRHTKAGGFDGTDRGTIANGYWDTDTSGTEQGSGDGNETGLTGLTTAQFQSGLPAGFDPSIWAEDSNINNGFPYLIANPPAK